MSGAKGMRRPLGPAGFTLVELIVSMVVSLVVLSASYDLLVTQTRQHVFHRETMDARETLRGAGALLMSELQPAFAARGDLYAIGPQSIAFRAFRGAGVICDQVGADASYELWQSTGTFGASTADSVLLYSDGSQSWRSVRVTQQQPAATPCAWGSGFTPDLQIDLAVATAADTLGVLVGSGVRAFQRTEYGVFEQNGRWWLGRKLGAATTFDLVTGPLRAPDEGGMALRYFDAGRALTTVAADVKLIELVLRSESFGAVNAGAVTGLRGDSLRVLLSLRN